MITATRLFLILLCCLLAGCAVKRPVIRQSVQVFDSMGGKEFVTYTVHCPSDPRDDGLWFRPPTASEAKQYCAYWHKWNQETIARRELSEKGKH